MSPPMVEIDVVLSEYPFPDFLGPVRKRAAEFEQAHPEYEITIQGCYYEDLPAEVSRRTLAGRPPTIASYYSGASQQAIDTVRADGRPLFTSVGREVGDRTEILGEPVILNDLIEACQTFYRINDDLAAVPLTLSTMLLYSNMTMLRAAGLSTPPRTWDEVSAACEALTGGPAYPITWPDDGKLFQHWITQQGGAMLDADNGRAGRASRVDLTSPPLLALVDWWHRLNRGGYYLYTGTFEDWAGNGAAFVGERVALRVDSSFAINFMGGPERDGLEETVTLLPHNDRVSPVGNWIGGDAMWLADGLDPVARDGALAFMMYLNSPENAAQWHRASGSTPVTESAVALLAEEGWFDNHPAHRVAVEQLRRATVSAPVIPGSHGVQTAIMAAMEDVLVRAADPATRFARAQVEAQAALDAYNATCLAGVERDPNWLRVGT